MRAERSDGTSGGGSSRSVVAPVRAFLHTEASGGIVLFVAAVAALVWANSGAASGYTSFWQHEVAVGIGPVHLDETLQLWVNDLAMALFFFVVGLEIKREIVHGELREPRNAVLPIACAVGGMVVPALIFTAFNAGHPATSGGWGVPMATDIAFSIGVLTLLGRRVPFSMRVFLLTLAIVDDIGAIVVIAVFYSDTFALGWFLGALGALALVVVLQRVGVRSLLPYVVVAGVAWLAMFESGVHATIAGVVLGLLTPAHPVGDEAESPLARLEPRLHPWSAFVVLPLFALANAGVSLSGGIHLGSALTRGIVLGLVVGKPVGVLLAAALALRFGGARLPAHAGWLELLGGGLLAGIGFTVSLFVSGLAFEGELVDQAKLAVLLASCVAAAFGAVALLARGTAHPLAGPDAVDRSRPAGSPEDAGTVG